ncbi:TPA: DUF4135 domain-containing protein, partial [Staphylococcus aureus]|nr:DUF4135 domain-containing protein [Staphylococcus aureus]
MNLTKEYILNEVYKDTNINDYQHYLDAFIEPIYRIIVENEVENEKIRSMINFNYCDNAIHLKKILSESVKLYTNETFKKSKSTDIIEMLNSINTLEFINQFYDSFELLYDKVIKYILKILGYYKSIYTELKKNRDKIKEIFQCDFDDLKNIKINLGDRHLYNIPTTLIQYKERNFYYKNKDALYEDLFYNVFSYFDKDFTYESSIKLSNGYLQKEIKMDSISNHPQMFRNAGKLIFIAYFLGTTDLHYENLILNNNYFKPIDCETIFDIDQYYCSEDKSVHYNLRNSVANTGLLPCKSINSFVVSGFSSYNVPLFDNDINITFEKNKAISYTFNNSNEKTEKNKTLDFYNNIEDIIDGFEYMYLKYLNSNKKKIHNSIINQFNGIKSRSLEKNTFDYYKILNESYHPYLVISNTRDNFFSNCKLTTHEVLQLLEDFIPVKHKEINLTEKYFDKFTLQDLQLQKCIIRECFIAERAFYNKKYQVVSSCKNNTFKGHLSDYISCLKNTSAIYNDNIMIFDFIIIGDNNKGYDFEVTIMPKEIYLGTSGVIHFLMNFTKYNDDEELSNLLNYLIKDLELYVEKTINHDEISVGYFDGLSGILHILTKFYKFNRKKLI